MMANGRSRALALVVAGLFLLAACGGDSETVAEVIPEATAGVQQDGEASIDAEEVAAAEQRAAEEAAAQQRAAEEAAAEQEAAAQLEAAKAYGRTGPIRELPGLVEWADLDLQPFLVETLNMPADIPIPDGIAPTWVAVTQNFSAEDGSSSMSFNGRFSTELSVDEFQTGVSALFDSATFTAEEPQVDDEEATTRLQFMTEDETSSFWSISMTYQEATADNEAEVSIGTSSNHVEGRTDLVVNEVLFPWMGELEVDPTWSRWFAATDFGHLAGQGRLDIRWNSPAGSFEDVAAFIAAPTWTGFTPGEQEFDDSPWPTYETDVTREDGFTGRYTVNETDPEDESSISLIGTTDLTGTESN